MRTLWFGLVLLALAATAQADKLTSTAGAPTVGQKPAVKLPAKRVARLQTAKPKLSKAELAAAVEALRVMTNDPILGNADKVHGDEVKGLVAFTFDDGPNPDTTPAVIDALEKYNIPATFFIVTKNIDGDGKDKHREILKRQLAAGFEIGSHSVSHKNLKRARPTVMGFEIDESIKMLAPKIERTIGLFRPPFGSFTPLGTAHLKKLGLTDVRWSVDTRDWQATDAEKLRRTTLSMIINQDGGIVLMHDVKPITALVITHVLDDLEIENCKRLTQHRAPLVPVSLHYWLKDGKTPRPIPDAVKKRTEAYRAALPGRCATRSGAPLPPLPPPPSASDLIPKWK